MKDTFKRARKARRIINQTKETKMVSKNEHRTQQRLEYLRGEIEAERISYGEISELQSLAANIEPGDVLLLEWAGVPE